MHGALSPGLLLVLADLQAGVGVGGRGAAHPRHAPIRVYAADPLADDALWLAANLLLEQQKPEQARALLPLTRSCPITPAALTSGDLTTCIEHQSTLNLKFIFSCSFDNQKSSRFKHLSLKSSTTV